MNRFNKFQKNKLTIPNPLILSSQFSPSSWFKNLKIQQKISLGYFIALGVAIAGTTTGILAGNHYQFLAEERREDSLEESQFLNQLQISLLQTLTHRHILAGRLDQPDVLRQEYELFHQSLEDSKKTWDALKVSYANPEVEETTEELEVYEKLIDEYDGVIQEYGEQSEFLQQVLEQNPLSLSQIQATRSELVASNLNSTSIKLEHLVHGIGELMLTIEDEYEEAQADLEHARALKMQIIFGSMTLSAIVAILLAIYTSRAISQPIQEATRIARKINEENDFDLKVPVLSTDEIGQLNTTFNDLIEQVKYLLTKQKNTQNQLIQAEKMSSLGQLVAGIAHEINNPVNFIHGNLSYMDEYAQDLLKLVRLYHQTYPEATPEIQEVLETIELDFLSEDISKIRTSMETGTTRIREIVQSLRNFSRTDEAELKTVDVHLGLESTLMILGHRMKAKPESPEIQVIRDYGNLPLVECYPGPLNQVFMNLLSNAIDALEEVNRSKTYKEIEANPNIIRIWTTVVEQHRIAVHISDNGPGVSQKAKSRLFDPFFTTKPIGKGTGLGLSISHQIITEQHKGTLECHSSYGKGTEFIIQIPVR